MPSLLRPEILAAAPENGDHLLVYGRISEKAIDALRRQRRDGAPVRRARRPDRRCSARATCCSGRSRTRRSSTTCAPAGAWSASAGYSLMSEAVYLRKPMLALPLAGQFEQEMNARYLERLGFGTVETCAGRGRAGALPEARAAARRGALRLPAGRQRRRARAGRPARSPSWRRRRSRERPRDRPDAAAVRWAFGLAGIEIEIEGGYGWAERLPTWYLKRGSVGARLRPGDERPAADRLPRVRVRDPAAGAAPAVRRRASTGRWPASWSRWHVLRAGRGLGLPVVRAQPRLYGAPLPQAARSGGSRSRGSAVPARLLLGVALCVALSALGAWSAGSARARCTAQLWMLAGLGVLIALAVLVAPLYHRWYRHMRRTGADDRAVTTRIRRPRRTRSGSGGTPDLSSAGGRDDTE